MEMMGNATAKIRVAWPSVVAILLLALCCGRTDADLDPAYYDLTCPELQIIVREVVAEAIIQEARMGASLLRLHFHDCFVLGCDGSILLDDNSTFKGEKTAGPNNGSVRGFNVIDDIKSAVENMCPGVVSCADIVALAARDSVVILGGPYWSVALGRRDSTTASLSLANTNLPGPGSSLSQLISKFQNQGLSTTDMIALSGAHTIGQAQCKNFRSHIYNDSNINGWYATSLKGNCPFSGGDTNLSPLDYRSPTLFNNDYYKNLVAFKGLLHSDQQLNNHGSADSTVKFYSANQRLFFNDFVSAMISMGNINPLTGTKGEIRTNCRRVN